MASSELEDSAAEAKEQYPDDGKLIEDFMWALKGACPGPGAKRRWRET